MTNIIQYDIILDASSPPSVNWAYRIPIFREVYAMNPSSKVFAFVIFVFAFFLSAQSAEAATITVRQDGSGDYTTITDAVAAADPNDTIEVGPGTYKEEIWVEKSLTIISQYGAVFCSMVRSPLSSTASRFNMDTASPTAVLCASTEAQTSRCETVTYATASRHCPEPEAGRSCQDLS
jgi:hypothetical protein